MTRKLPIAETAVEALMFGLKRTGTAFRLAWPGFVLYLLLAAGALFFLLSAYPEFHTLMAALGEAISSGGESDLDFDFDDTMGVPDPARLALAMVMFSVAAAAFVPAYVVISRVAAGDIEAPRTWFYFTWGGREWRTVLTFVGIQVAMVGLCGALAVGMGPLLLTIDDPVFAWVPVVLPIVMVVLSFWLILRCALIIPAAAIENDINAFEAFGATGGNVFRLIGSFILLMIMLCASVLAAFLVVLVGSIVMSVIVGSVGAETQTGIGVGVVGAILAVSFMIYVYGAFYVAFLAWPARAWAALRPDAAAD